jgi:hypothetical protein
MSRYSEIDAFNRLRARWQAARTLNWNPRWAGDGRLIVLTVLNAFVFWPWIWLRNAFNAGDHHPSLVFCLLLLTLYLWTELARAVTHRFK